MHCIHTWCLPARKILRIKSWKFWCPFFSSIYLPCTDWSGVWGRRLITSSGLLFEMTMMMMMISLSLLYSYKFMDLTQKLHSLEVTKINFIFFNTTCLRAKLLFFIFTRSGYPSAVYSQDNTLTICWFYEHNWIVHKVHQTCFCMFVLDWSFMCNILRLLS